MKKLLITLTVLFFSFLLRAQTFLDARDNALEAIQNQNFSLAEKEIQRAIFFSPDSCKVDNLLIASDIFAASGKGDDAIFFLNSAYSQTLDGVKKEEIVLKKADLLIFEKKFQDAKICALQTSCNDDSLLVKKKYLRLAICEFCLENYIDSENYFKKITSEQKHEELNKIFFKTKRLKNPKNKLASVLSIIPGLGQYYSSNFWQGIDSEIILGAFSGLFVIMQARYGTLSAFLAVFPWFQRYYVGGIKNAGRCAQLRREIKKNKMLNKALKNI